MRKARREWQIIGQKNEKNKKRMANNRAKQSLEEKLEKNEKEKKRMAENRAKQSVDKKKEKNEKNKKRMADKWASQQTAVYYKEALRSKEIMEGCHVVKDLSNSEDSIGRMEFECQHCSAKKFKKETPTTCCNNGKVLLDPFPQPPPKLNNIWHANTPEAPVFRENA